MKKCPICSSQKIKKGGFIEVCKSCGFYVSDFHYSTNVIASHYDGYSFEKHLRIALSHQEIYEIIVDRLKKHFRNLRSLKVLEIGFGHGYLLKRLCDEGLECYGIDISVSAVNNAVRIGLKKDRLFLGDFADFNFNSRFDVIIINSVLEEFRDPLFVMDKIKNITSRNSVIIIRTKNASFHRFAYKYLNFFSFLIKSPGVFVSCGFTYKSIVILLSKYDFEIEDVYLNLTKGDPYKQFSFSSFLGFIKKVYYFISLLFFKLSLKHILISPSFMVFAVRKR